MVLQANDPQTITGIIDFDANNQSCFHKQIHWMQILKSLFVLKNILFDADVQIFFPENIPHWWEMIEEFFREHSISSKGIKVLFRNYCIREKY